MHLQELSLSDLKKVYRDYLKTQNLSENTINTACNDGFYLWKHREMETFWNAVTDPNFPELAQKELYAALTAHSSVSPEKYLSGYVSHLRRFRNFYMETHPDSLSLPKPPVLSERTERKPERQRTPRPTQAEVDSALEQWRKLDNYTAQERALDLLYLELCPENQDLRQILLKVAALNDFYSTHIFSVYTVALHIQSLNIDRRLRAGDWTLVDEMANVEIGNQEKHFYSFASKYCSHHRPDAFPIYDYYVDKILRYFQKKDRFSDFSGEELKNYPRFCQILEDFRQFYGLQEVSLKNLDRYLWLTGKKYFPKNYGTPKT